MIEISTGQLLTITSGIMLCPIGELYKALNAITGDNLYTHMLPEASRFATGPILEVHPWAGYLPMYSGEGTEEAVYAYLDTVSSVQGDSHTVPYLGDSWENKDPITSLAEMMNSGNS